MSDGQAYLLLLAAFYLAETCAFARPGSILLNSFRGKKFSPRSAVLPMGGIGKELFFKPLLPGFPVSCFLPSLDTPDLRAPTPASVARLRRLTLKATSDLRLFSFAIFVLFFFATPIAYLYRGDSPLTNLLIAYGYGLMVLNGILYFCLHRRFLPKKGLWSETFFCAFLPWHAMRSASHLFLTPSLRTHPLSTLLSLPPSPKRDQLLSELWRELAKDGPDPRFQSWLAHRDLDPANLSPVPQADSPDATQYCPQCSATYTEAATKCADCEDSPLLPLADS